MSVPYEAWVVSRCHARGLANIWRYLDEYSDHRPGRVHRAGRPDLMIAIPCGEPHSERCIEPGGAGDIGLEPGKDGVTQALAFTSPGADLLAAAGWAEPPPEPEAQRRAGAGVDRVRRLSEEGRLVKLPAPMDPSAVRYVMSQQEFHVLEAMIISHDLCTGCRLCESVCPPQALERVEGRIRMTGDCVVGACGLCYMSCPQMLWQLGLVRRPEGVPARPVPLTARLVPADLPEALEMLVTVLRARRGEVGWRRFDTEEMGGGFLAARAKALRRLDPLRAEPVA
jgi:ferredoxin